LILISDEAMINPIRWQEKKGRGKRISPISLDYLPYRPPLLSGSSFFDAFCRVAKFNSWLQVLKEIFYSALTGFVLSLLWLLAD